MTEVYPSRPPIMVIIAAVASALVFIVVGILLILRHKKKTTSRQKAVQKTSRQKAVQRQEGADDDTLEFKYNRIENDTCDGADRCGGFERFFRGRTLEFYKAEHPANTARLGSYAGCKVDHDHHCLEGTTMGILKDRSVKTPVYSITADMTKNGSLTPVHPKSFKYVHTIGSTSDHTHNGTSPFEWHGTVWKMVCPSGYVSLGDVVIPGKDKKKQPDKTQYACVPKKCVDKGKLGGHIWKDDYFTLYRVTVDDADKNADGHFFRIAKHGTHPTDLYVLKNKCTASS